MSRPTFDENRDLSPMSAQDMMWVTVASILAVTACAILALVALRDDRPEACDPYPTYAECSAAVAEGR